MEQSTSDRALKLQRTVPPKQSSWTITSSELRTRLLNSNKQSLPLKGFLTYNEQIPPNGALNLHTNTPKQHSLTTTNSEPKQGSQATSNSECPTGILSYNLRLLSNRALKLHRVIPEQGYWATTNIYSQTVLLNCTQLSPNSVLELQRSVNPKHCS